MDKQLLFPNFLNSDYKLTRAASFSELSTTRKVSFEQQFQTEMYRNLVKQYSCEQIFDKKSNISHFKVCHKLKSDNEEHVDTWKSSIPIYSSLTNSEWSKEINKSCLKKQYSSANSTLKEPDIINSREIITSPILVIEKNRSKQLNEHNQKDFHDYKQRNNEKLYESIFQFKKPSLSIKKPSTLRNYCNVHDELTTNNNILNVCNLPEQTKRNMCIKMNKQKVDTSELKTKLRSLVPTKQKKKEHTYFCWFFMFIVLIPIAVIYLAVFLNNSEVSNGFCNPHFKIHKIPEELKNLIHGQDSAIDVLTKYFKKRENQTGFDVVSLIGGTGVGKSYTAEIIKNNIKDIYNILDFFPPFYEKENEAYTSLSVCQCNLIRLENIKTNDISDSITFINKLNKRVNNYCILILALFNTQTTDYYLKKTLDMNKSISLIDNKFKEIRLQSTWVNFTTMSDETLKKCIIDAANYNNMILTNDDIEYIKSDLLRADSGCKGAHAKVQLVGKTRILSDL